MERFKELELDTTLSVAVIVTGLVVGWFTYSIDTAAQYNPRIAAEDGVTITQEDGRFKMTVTAQRPRDFVPEARKVSTRGAEAAPAKT